MLVVLTSQRNPADAVVLGIFGDSIGDKGLVLDHHVVLLRERAGVVVLSLVLAHFVLDGREGLAADDSLVRAIYLEHGGLVHVESTQDDLAF